MKKQTYCQIKRSKIHGVGVIAIRNISKGVNPFPGVHRVKWHGLEKRELAHLPPKIVKLLYGFFAIQGKKLWIPESGLTGMDMSFYMNTSKKPNVRILGDGDKFRTMRKIKAGEELTVDYDTFSEREF